MSIKLADAVVYLTGDRKGLDKTLKKSEKDTTTWAAKVGKKIKAGLGTALKAGALGAAAGVTVLVAGITKLAIDSAKVDQVRGTFDKLAESIGSDGVAALDSLRDATRGMVADADLMAAGNKFMAMGLATSAEEAAKLAEIATQLGSAMGEEATPSMENFALLLANEATARLDSFGISSGTVTKRILELKEANEGMTRSEAFKIAVMEEAAVTMAKVGEQGDTTAASMARIQATGANLKDMLGRAFLPIMDKVLGVFGDLATKYGPAVEVWIKEKLPEAIGKLTSFWNDQLLPAITAIVDYWKTDLQPAFVAIWAFIQDNLTPILAGLAAMLLITVVPAFVAWAAGAATAAAATITALAPVLIPIAAIGLAVALLAKAWETDFMGMRTLLTEVWEQKLEPIFELLKTWLQETLTEALATLTTFWSETLLPAIKDVWAFIDEYLLPVFRLVADILDVALTLAVTALAGLWQNVLQPALKTAWEWFGKLYDLVSEKVAPLMDKLKDKMDKAAGGLDGVKKAIGWVVEKLQALKDWLDRISIPDWLTPGSPTPFELGLRGIRDAMHDLTSTELPQFAASLALTGAAGAGGGMSPVSSVTNHWNLSAQYGYQSEGSLADTVTLLQMAAG